MGVQGKWAEVLQFLNWRAAFSPQAQGYKTQEREVIDMHGPGINSGAISVAKVKGPEAKTNIKLSQSNFWQGPVFSVILNVC